MKKKNEVIDHPAIKDKVDSSGTAFLDELKAPSPELQRAMMNSMTKWGELKPDPPKHRWRYAGKWAHVPVRSIHVSRTAFVRNVNKDDLKKIETALGYASHHNSGLTMQSDSTVGYSRGTDALTGERVYFFFRLGDYHPYVFRLVKGGTS